MRKLGMFLVLAMVVASVMPGCKSTSDLEKARQKQFQTKLKEFKKDGWTIFGSTRTLDVALLEHYEKLKSPNAVEEVGLATAFISKNVGQQSAMNAACNNYARRAQSMIRGRVLSDIFNDADDVPAEFDKFYAAYESMVVKEIKGEMQPSFSVIRSKGKDNNGKEVFEMQSFFIVDEDAASKARIRAMESAFNESNMAQKYAKQVSEFVRTKVEE